MSATRKTRQSAGATASALDALRLLGVWTRLAQGHLPLGSGCSCGGGAGSIAVADLERDIVEYLRGRHPAMTALLNAPGGEPVACVLRACARPDAAHTWTLAEQRALLQDLSRTIESFERAHRGG